jgi:nucleotide-binding universal stress UspA family protein
MYDKIIIGLSLDHGFSANALNAARSLINENGEIIAVHVSEPLNKTAKLYLSDEDVANAKQWVKEEFATRLDKQDDVESVILSGHAGRDLPDYAEKTGADCIIVGSHKPGLEDFFLGSTSARVVRHAKCAVHVLR